MRSRPVQSLLIGICALGLSACHPPKAAAPARPLIEPPPGWRMARQEPRRETYGATFVPKQRTSQEKMWVTILRKPQFLGKSTDELFQVFQPHFMCKDRDLNVLKKDQNEILFEERDSTCYGQNYRYTVGRITKGKAAISYFAYRADVPNPTSDRRDFVLKTLTTAPLDASGGPAPASSTAPGASTAPGGGASSQ
jgi:hypothetical protein